ncbi:TOBE domain-containing protein [Salinisphaera sp. USBA-960]|uniref:TOBE domain-containing protein n=1 Tax=Salinisphaera orenii TaxID=856731 RepID=UPI000DBE533F|nr:TOBE domain-containing protein [Salifodinibacter halophilus]NNC25503.1 TOBE domain-containing protein [Salifodinibacter halophilus]
MTTLDRTHEIAGDLRIGGSDSPIGSQRIALLEQIAATGSLAAAARAVGLSYKGAWDAVHAMNNLSDNALVVAATGGTGGGGSHLSARGEQLVRVYRAAAEEQKRFIARLNQRIDFLQSDLDLVGRLAMQTSARNQFYGHVVSVTRGAVNAEVMLELSGGAQLAATITNASADNLAIDNETRLIALIKASEIILAAGHTPAVSLSTRNQLTGTVTTITRDNVNAEIVLQLAGNNTIAAVITRSSADTMGLAEGEAATAFFKASSVILAQCE